MNFVIRAAVADDMPALGRLGAMLVALHHDFDADRFLTANAGTESAYGAFLDRQARDADAVVLVAEKAGVVLGYAYGKIEAADYMALRGPAGMLHDLIVEPSRRREGVGRQLLNAMIAALSERGAPRLVLSTAARNVAAQRLFASAGFRQTMIEMTREPTLAADCSNLR